MTVKVPEDPRSLKLPHIKWRTHQAETIQKALDSPKHVVFISAPTGSGKSTIAVTAAKLYGRKSGIITHSKQLQKQYLREFRALDLQYLIGRENYKCIIDEKYTVNNAPCTAGFKCPRRMQCTYYATKMRAAQFFSPIVSNYSYFLNENTHGAGVLANLDILILDEGHLAENSLMSHVNVTLDDLDLRKVGAQLPKLSTIKQYRDWALNTAANLSTDLVSITAYLEQSDDPFAEEMLVERHRKLSKICSCLISMNKVKEDWIMEKHNRKVMFRPLWVKDYGSLYTRVAKKVIIQSATIVNPKKTAELLGIEDFDYIESPSLFPKERRPFNYYPVVKVDSKNTEQDLQKLVEAVDEIIEHHNGERGIVHTSNYRLRDILVMRSKFKDILLTHTPDRRETVIEEFLTGEGKKRILVSPSVTSGIDGSYHRCSFQIIMKIPFRDRKEEQVKRRMAEDQEWYSYSAACDIVQAYGRAMRHEDDYGVTYMLDEHFGWFYKYNKEMFPKFFQEAVRKIEWL